MSLTISYTILAAWIDLTRSISHTKPDQTDVVNVTNIGNSKFLDRMRSIPLHSVLTV